MTGDGLGDAFGQFSEIGARWIADHVIESALAQHLRRQLLVAISGDHEHRGVVPLMAQTLQQLGAAHVIEDIIEQNEVKRGLGQDDQGVGAGVAYGDLMAGAFQAQPRYERDVVVVFDQE